MNAKNEEKDACAVERQRDELRRSLGDLYDAVRSGVLNDLLPEKNARCGIDPNDKCDAGLDRPSVKYGCGRNCVDCYKKHHCGKCHISYQEFKLFESMKKAIETCSKPDSEMPMFGPSDFPEYDPVKDYMQSPVETARTLYRLIVCYWQFSDHSDVGLEKKWERAFDDSIAIALGPDGHLFRDLIEFGRSSDGDDGDRAKEFMDGTPGMKDWINRLHESFNDGGSAGQCRISKVVDKLVVLRMEYRFGHVYPGADVGVYGDAFMSIASELLKSAGVDEGDAPKIYDFEDEDEYDRAVVDYGARLKRKVYGFMSGEYTP